MNDRNFEEKEELVVRLLREADRVPPAPDCRASVAARISEPARGRGRLIVALASVSVTALICAAVYTVTIAPDRESADRGAGEQVRRPAPSAATETVTAAPERTEGSGERMLQTGSAPQIAVPRAAVASAPVQRVNLRPPGRKTVATQQPAKPAAPTPPAAAPYVAAVTVPAAAENAEDTPVALVVTKWPAETTQGESYYAYTEHDSTTGQTISCEVSRSGDSVTIRLESEDNGGETPLKGSVTDDAVPSA